MSPEEKLGLKEYRVVKRIRLFKEYRKYLDIPRVIYKPQDNIMFIENVSLQDIEKGFHFDAGDNSMLIQIVDPDMDFPNPKHPFKEVRQFKFLDVENFGDIKFTDAIQDWQATAIAADLVFAKDNHMNVIVHCHAGICRSGAVVDCGIQLGFQDTGKFRMPNLMVKHKVLQALGLEFNPNEVQEGVNGKFTVSGIQYF